MSSAVMALVLAVILALILPQAHSSRSRAPSFTLKPWLESEHRARGGWVHVDARPRLAQLERATLNASTSSSSTETKDFAVAGNVRRQNPEQATDGTWSYFSYQNYTMDPLRYSGGYLMTSQVDVYLIWYGKWTAKRMASAKAFINDMSSHSYWGVVKQYGVVGSLGVAGVYEDPHYMQGININGIYGGTYNTSGDIINYAVKTGKIAQQPFAMYAVMMDTAASSVELCIEGGCQQHYLNWFEDGSTYQLIDAPSVAVCSCSSGLPDSLSPSGDAAMDDTLSGLIHEIIETVTDYDNYYGWLDLENNEIMDKCYADYGPTFQNASIVYNLDLPVAGKFFIQSIWDNERDGCFLTSANYTPPAPYIQPVVPPSQIQLRGNMTDCQVLALSFPTINFGADCCQWSSTKGEGIVSCDKKKSVTQLTIANEGLNGTLPAMLSTLYNLQYLNLSHNALHGDVPASYAWNDLSSLDLSFNKLSGSPVNLQYLTTLGSLYLNDNNFTGNLADYSRFSYGIGVINLGNNHFYGSVPDWLGSVPLYEVYLHNNNLTGPIPPSLALSTCNIIDLSYNHLSGPLPSALVNLALQGYIVWFNLEGNYGLTGTIPSSLAGIASFPNTGAISFVAETTSIVYSCTHDTCEEGAPMGLHCGPCERVVTALDAWCGSMWWDVICVKEVEMHCNRTCTPPNVGKTMSLPPSYAPCAHDVCVPGAALDMSCSPCANNVTSSDYICGLVAWDLTCVHEAEEYCGITCPQTATATAADNYKAPASVRQVGQTDCGLLMQAFPSLHYDSGCCNLSPKELICDSNGSITYLSLHGRALSGPIPTQIASLTSITYLDLSSNSLTGDMSPLLALKNITNINLAYNGLTGTLPQGLGNLTNLKSLNVSSNELQGALPTSFGNLMRLATLDVSWNNLTGPLTADLSGMINLQKLNMRGNAITGVIPAWLEFCSGLSYLDLASNRFYGTIPSFLGELTQLQVLRLSDNRLSGIIPDSFVDAYLLWDLEIDINAFNGPVVPIGLDLDYVIYDVGRVLYQKEPVGNCSHGFANVGAPLQPDCGPCVETVVKNDAFCSNVAWDSICVSQAATCPAPTKAPARGFVATAVATGTPMAVFVTTSVKSGPGPKVTAGSPLVVKSSSKRVGVSRLMLAGCLYFLLAATVQM
ncbi:hypothetical protein HK101_006249 [Irineochytrium annulatum]|nr:hypothetical protein HK101_006249 [Irineochytrium annulatum]